MRRLALLLLLPSTILATRSSTAAFIRLSSPLLAQKGGLSNKKAFDTLQADVRIGPSRRRMVTTTTMAKDPPSGSIGIVWYKSNDLRTLDHEPLVMAHRENKKVLHLFCFDPRWFGPPKGTIGAACAPGTLKTGYHRTRFMKEAVEDLAGRLKEAGNGLIVKQGKPEEEISKLVQLTGAINVYSHLEVTSEEKRTVKKVLDNIPGGVKLRQFWGGNYLFHINDIPFEEVACPTVFTQFRKIVESKCSVGKALPVPPSLRPAPEVEGVDLLSSSSLTMADLGFPDPPEADPRVSESSVMTYGGGEKEGLARVKQYIWELDLLKEYKDTRKGMLGPNCPSKLPPNSVLGNGMLGPNYSSKFSPWLAMGAISPRYIFAEIRKYERERVENDSTYWLFFELIWRDFFRYSAMSMGNHFFKLGGPQQNPSKYPWKRDLSLFQAWKEGKTGYPLVDANMRELAATGFMSNRGRQIVASFMTRDLSLDWRMGAAYFEEVLLDYDPCSNWGNWCYAAGVGSDPREDRYFSIPKQGATYDPEAKYIKHWCPELQALPADAILQPHRFDASVRQTYDISEEVYPRQIVPLKFGGGGGGGRKSSGGGGHGGSRRGGSGGGGGGSSKSKQPFRGPRRPTNRIQSAWMNGDDA